mmetsp:Transcript_3934/g.10312  ORF Transcript_3934/g.10312 Transcript_3934/m.10312 type:complete len:218 (-) Transcript_3934:322-975(-)
MHPRKHSSGAFHRPAVRTKSPMSPVLWSGTRLEPETRQPSFHFEDSVPLNFEGPTVPNPNFVVPGILWDRDSEDRSQLVKEETPVARDFFDPGGDPRTVLSIFRINGKKSDRIVGFVFGSGNSEGKFLALPVVDRDIPPIVQNLGINDGRFNGRFRDDATILATYVLGILFFPSGDATFRGILFEESLYLCRRMLGSGCNGGIAKGRQGFLKRFSND